LKYPTATRHDHQKFCEVEGWTRVRDARGRTGTHQLTYELTLPDGRVLRTRVSHPPDRTDIGKGLFSHILRDQLAVTVEAFWRCVADGVVPDRGAGVTAAGEPVPPEVVHLLTTKVGLSDDQVRKLTKAQAIARLEIYWTQGS